MSLGKYSAEIRVKIKAVRGEGAYEKVGEGVGGVFKLKPEVIDSDNA